MPSAEGDHKLTGAIRVRAQQLAAAGGGHDTAEAELLAALADGTLAFEQIDDHALARCIEALGPDSVVEALRYGAEEARASAKPALILDIRKPTPAGAWWSTRLSWVAAAAVIVVVGAIVFLATRTKKISPEQTVAENHLSLQWPAQPPFDPSGLKAWGAPTAPLPKQLPNFNQGPSTLGASGVNRFAPWQLATVIVRSEHGWGSGAFISRDGWLLSSYHVVAGAAQAAAVTGTPAKLEVITARMVNGRPMPQPALQATLYRADPVRDLALLKLDPLPGGRRNVVFFRLAANVRDGEDCFFVGPHKKGPPWSIRSGNVSRQFDYPERLRQSAAGATAASARERVRVVVDDVPLSPGDSGGPLLNASGELIGLGFATSANPGARSVGWHIALSQLRAFSQNPPAEPEGVPFDPWTAGLPEATVLAPELADADHDGRTDSLLYRYASSGGANRGPSQPLAITVFADLSERLASTEGLADLVPYGLWEMENRGGFRFDLFVTVRADHVVAVGYANHDSVIDEIRIGTQQDGTRVLWNRTVDGKWHASQPTRATPLIDSKRFGGTELGRLQAILRQALGDAGGRAAFSKDSAISQSR